MSISIVTNHLLKITPLPLWLNFHGKNSKLSPFLNVSNKTIIYKKNKPSFLKIMTIMINHKKSKNKKSSGNNIKNLWKNTIETILSATILKNKKCNKEDKIYSLLNHTSVLIRKILYHQYLKTIKLMRILLN